MLHTKRLIEAYLKISMYLDCLISETTQLELIAVHQKMMYIVCMYVYCLSILYFFCSSISLFTYRPIVCGLLFSHPARVTPPAETKFIVYALLTLCQLNLILILIAS